MDTGRYIQRTIDPVLRRQLERGKSVLLLGARQTGKTTLLARIDAALRLSLVQPGVRQRYEREPGILTAEIEAAKSRRTDARLPLVVIDEVQRVPALLDVVQDAVDRRLARFVLTGSSARRLRRGGVNLLPGRIVMLRLDPLSIAEHRPDDLAEALLYGSLPGVVGVQPLTDRERDLASYVETYLEEEIRAEALVRNVGTFARFLDLAGTESGGIVSFRAIAQELGLTHPTVAGYYEILEDCLVAERIDPVTKSRTRKKLTKSSRYLLFDLGVRRLCAREGTRPGRERLGQLFEQFVGLELLRGARVATSPTAVRFWRDPDGPEVDWIVERRDRWIPVEAKWTDAPRPADARHVETFLAEYDEADHGFVVCRTPRRLKLGARVTAIPWQELSQVLA